MSNGQGTPKTGLPLSEVVGRIEAPVRALEEMLGICQESAKAKQEEGYKDVPRRLKQRIGWLHELAVRLENIKLAVSELSEAVG